MAKVIKKTVTKECKVLIRLQQYENIEFKSGATWEIEFENEEERKDLERACWNEVVEDISEGLKEWCSSSEKGFEHKIEEYMNTSNCTIKKSWLEP